MFTHYDLKAIGYFCSKYLMSTNYTTQLIVDTPRTKPLKLFHIQIVSIPPT